MAGGVINLCSSPEPGLLPPNTTVSKSSAPPPKSTRKGHDWVELSSGNEASCSLKENSSKLHVVAMGETSKRGLAKPTRTTNGAVAKHTTSTKPPTPASKPLGLKNANLGPPGMSSSPLPSLHALRTATKALELPKKIVAAAPKRKRRAESPDSESDDNFNWALYSSGKDAVDWKDKEKQKAIEAKKLAEVPKQNKTAGEPLPAVKETAEAPKRKDETISKPMLHADSDSEPSDGFDWNFHAAGNDASRSNQVLTRKDSLTNDSDYFFGSPELTRNLKADGKSSLKSHGILDITQNRKGKKSVGDEKSVSDAAKAARNHWANVSLSDPSSSAPNPVAEAKTKGVPAGIDKGDLKGSKDFIYLDDDFDTTIMDDDPFKSPPSSKKQRISAYPKPREKHVGYQRTMSNIESGSSKARESGYKRTMSNVESSSKIGPFRLSSGPSKRSSVFDADPILFTSSPDHFGEAAQKRKDRKRKASDSDSSELEEIENIVPKKGGKRKEKEVMSKSKPKKRRKDDDVDGSDTSDTDFDEWTLKQVAAREAAKGSGSKPSKGSQPRKPSLDAAMAKYEATKAKTKEEEDKKSKAKEKAARSTEKKAEKAAEKERKAQEKVDKAKQKLKDADLTRVNTLKTDKKISQKEMIVELPSCMNEQLAERIQNFLGADGVEIVHRQWESRLPVIKWKRNVVAEFNTELDLWEPLAQPRVDEEKHIMYIMTAKEFVELVHADEGADLDYHVLRLKSKFEGTDIIYMIEGMSPWFKKNRLIQDRAFKEAVRSQGQEIVPPTASQRKKKTEVHVPEDGIEDALMRLQVTHNVLIHHTNVQQETAEWVFTFTQHISTIPYKKQRASLDTAFCMESGQVKTGEDAKDTYVKMLQEMHRITASVAHGIAAEYPTVQSLVKELRENGPLALQNCWKSANRDGAFTERRVGPAISKRVHKVFLGRDPGSWDV